MDVMVSPGRFSSISRLTGQRSRRSRISTLAIFWPTTQGSIGYTTNLFPSMTLGCGTPGGNIYSENIGPQHLINVKRIAYVNQAMLDEDERLEAQLRREFGDPILPWQRGGTARGGLPLDYQAAPRASAPRPSTSGSQGASPLTPADIEAILSRQGR